MTTVKPMEPERFRQLMASAETGQAERAERIRTAEALGRLAVLLGIGLLKANRP